MKRISLSLWALSLSSSLLAQDGMIDIKTLIPPEYYQIPTGDFGPVLQKLGGVDPRLAESQCRGGYRIGDRLGVSLVTKLNPSCDELLLPVGADEDNEWAVPATDFSSATKPAVLCHYLGYARAFERTVLNTALNCAKIFADSVTLSLQIEYNRCYVATAKGISKLHLTFAGGSSFITGDYVLVPRDSAAWDDFVASIVSVTDQHGDEQKSAYLIQACRLGTTHAQQRQPPVNFLDGKPHSSGP